MRSSLALTIAAVLFAGHAMAATPEPLPRRAALGVGLRAGSAGETVVDAVMPESRLALMPGDVVLQLDRAAVAGPDDLVPRMAGRRGGETVALKARRADKVVDVRGRLGERPRETYKNGVATYASTPFEGGLLREILVTPPGGARGPVLFLIQGYTCDSMETPPTGVHHALIEGLLARGISTYRIEKPGAGDSRGGPACPDIDFKTEVAAFQAGYRSLREAHGISPDRIFMLGHSLGGLESPLLAAAGPAPRGVAVYGTVTRNWTDYLLDVVRRQPFVSRGTDPVEADAIGEKVRPLIQRIYLGGEDPAAVAAAGPETAKLMRDWLGWDGGRRFSGRDVSFWRQISATPLLAAWRDTKSSVLAAYGESDFAAIDDGDHRLVADVVNHYRPGTARFVAVPATGHGMRLDGDRAAARDAAAKAAAPNAAPAGPPKPFNPELVNLFGGWIEDAMRAPPVSAKAAG